MNFQFYQVGGSVRDLLLGLKSKDIDYCVVLKDESMIDKYTPIEVYNTLCSYLEGKGYVIFVKKPECLTIRAKTNNHQVVDFALARKDITYSTDSRHPIVTLGTLKEDLLRRDFTINAIAMDLETHKYIDVCHGMDDLQNKILRTPNDTYITLLDDPLRILRGLRFSVTLNFTLSDSFWNTIHRQELWDKMEKTVSKERIREELNKMFTHNTIQSLQILNKLVTLFPNAYSILFSHIILKPTTN